MNRSLQVGLPRMKVVRETIFSVTLHMHRNICDVIFSLIIHEQFSQ